MARKTKSKNPLEVIFTVLLTAPVVIALFPFCFVAELIKGAKKHD